MTFSFVKINHFASRFVSVFVYLVVILSTKMENKMFLKCVVCCKDANFICQRCMDAYCTQECQIVHWPIHRVQCFPMPNLIPASNFMLSLYGKRAIQYPESNAEMREIANCSLKANSNNPTTEKMIKPKEIHDEPRINRNFRSPTKLRRKSSDYSQFKESVQIYPSLDAYRLVQKSRKSEHKLDRPVKQLEKWEKQFPFDTNDVVEVAVQHFTESPTTICWVTQRKHIEERNDLMKQIQKLHSSVETVKAGNIEVNELFCVLHEGVYHRGVVVYRINSQEVVVRLIDNGRTFQTQITTVRPLNKVSRDVNAFAFAINFETLRDVAIDETLRVKNISTSADGVTNVRIVEEDYRFSQNDIESIRIPVNVPLELFCLDTSNIELGYISACINDPQKIKSIDAISGKIFEYCKQQKGVQSYRPQLDELCLTYLDDEHQWYRAECLDVINRDTFLLVLIDYGCMRSVNSKNIRKMVKEFLEPTIMQMCIIHGIPKKPNNDVVAKILAYFSKNLIFHITNAKDSSEDCLQLIHIPALITDIMGRCDSE